MPKTIIIDESIINKGILNEAIEFNQLPKHLRIDVLRGKTPLSGNECFPYEGYFEKALADTFSGMQDYEVVAAGKATPDYVSKLERGCQKLEKPMRSALEELVSATVTELFEMPIEKVDFSLEIVDSIDQSKSTVPFGPNEEMPAGLATIDDIDYISNEVTKRKFQNALNAGAARFFTDEILYSVVSNLDEIKPGLYEIYEHFLTANDYLLYTNPVVLTEKDRHESGRVVVTLGNDEVKNHLKAEGTIFPILVYETVKGFFEMFTSHGLPSDETIAKAVVSKSDYLLAEPWYMRIGFAVWHDFYNILNEVSWSAELLPYIFMKISELPAEKYIRLMKEILAGTEKSKKVMKRVCEYARKKIEQSDFDDRISNIRNNGLFMIDDEKQI